MSSLKKIRLSVLVIVCTAVVSAAYAEVSPDHIDEIIAVFESGQRQQIRVTVDELGFSGITDERLFDVVEQQLKVQYRTGGRDEELFTGWLIKALSYSGNPKYLTTLKNISNTQAQLYKVRRYAADGVEDLERYTRWNPDIGRDVTGLTGTQLSRKRTANMLGSSHQDLVLIGIKRVYNLHPYDAELAALVADKLNAVDVYSQKQADFVGWSFKALSRSGMDQYKKVLEKYAGNRLLPNSSRKHAKMGLKLIVEEIARFPVVNNNPDNLAGSVWEQQRIKNMLQSKDSYLVREGARHIYYHYSSNAELLGLAEQRLLQRYRSSGNNQFKDATAWLCKVLAYSGMDNYAKTIQQVATGAMDRSLKKSASKYLEHLQAAEKA